MQRREGRRPDELTCTQQVRFSDGISLSTYQEKTKKRSVALNEMSGATNAHE